MLRPRAHHYLEDDGFSFDDYMHLSDHVLCMIPPEKSEGSMMNELFKGVRKCNYARYLTSADFITSRSGLLAIHGYS
jgi:hypothetical protein